MSAITPVVKVGDLGTAFDITVKQPTNPADPSGAKTAIDFTHADYFRCEDCAEKHSEEGYRLYWGKPSKDYQQKLSDNGGHNDR